MSNEDLVEQYNSVCEKCKKIISRANEEIAKSACLEVELAGMRVELKAAYEELTELKYQRKLRDI
jgi:hypothetical protein